MTDAHCHLWDLREFIKDAEEERRKFSAAIAASSCTLEEFLYHEDLAKKGREEKAPPIFCCFALHPQLSLEFLEKQGNTPASLEAGLELLELLAGEGRLHAVGETGFDLYDARYKAGEKIQDELFSFHLKTALKYNLPLVLHLRKAMHKIFPFAKELKKLPAVVFHSWPGTRGEGEAFLRKKINAFFSFGSAVLKNHKNAIDSAAHFPSDAILLETDAPYQPLKGKTFSSFSDLNIICKGIVEIRKEAGSPCGTYAELEEATTANFYRAFGN